MTPGKRIRAMRQARGWKLQALARKAGIRHTTLLSIEYDRTAPSVRTALGIARALGTTVEELFAEITDPDLLEARRQTRREVESKRLMRG